MTRKLHLLSRWNQRNLETTGAPDVCSQKAGSVRTATANSITYVRKSINRTQENGCTTGLSLCRQQGGASRCDVALAFSAVQPSLASVDPDDPVGIKVECVISWSTEEKEDMILLENCINSGFYSWKDTCYGFGITWFHGLSLVIISPDLVIYEEVGFSPVVNSCIDRSDAAWEAVV